VDRPPRLTDRSDAARRRFAIAAKRLGLDGTAVVLLDSLAARGVDAIIVKGPALAHWLYPDGDRWYVDIDLYVPPDAFGAAQDVLAAAGFTRHEYYVDRPDDWTFHDEAWIGPRAHIDLHRTLAGLAADPADAWRVLSARTATMTLVGREVTILDEPATALHVALHAAVHGVGVRQPLADLERALERWDDAVWGEAAALAAELRSSEAFAAGLRLSPAGSRLAERLELPRTVPLDIALAATTPPRGTRSLQRLAAEPGIVAKARIAARWIVPPASHVRASSARARRGTGGLVVAYVLRLVNVARLLGPALAARRKVARELREVDR
jgi:Uncharacterised nucleotidyltransferase